MTPYRIVVFATGVKVTGKGKRRRETKIGYGYMGWTETQAFIEARLPGAGSFLYAGMHTVRAAALEYLALPETHQLVIKTDQDRTVYRYVKAPDGQITGYAGDRS